MPRQDRLRRGPGERRLTGQHLVQHAAEGVDVRAAVQAGRGGGLLGAHVGGCAQREPGLGQPRPTGDIQRPGDTEVGNQRPALGQEDVLGLDVAMDHALAVGIVQRCGDLTRDPDRLGHRELGRVVQPVPKRTPRDTRHRVVEHRRCAGELERPRVEERENVRVAQPRGDGDLAGEPAAAQRAGDLGAQDLERHSALVLRVVRQVDGGHPAPAELALDQVGAEPLAGSERLMLGNPGHQRRRVRRRRHFEKAVADPAGTKQPLDFAQQRGIARAGFGEVAGATVGGQIQRAVEDRLDRRPALQGWCDQRCSHGPSVSEPRSAAQLDVQPGARLDPVSFHCPGADPQRLGSLLRRQAAEVAALDDLAQPLVYGGEAVQRLVQSDQRLSPLGGRDVLVHRYPTEPSTPAQGAIAAGVVHQDPSHGP